MISTRNTIIGVVAVTILIGGGDVLLRNDGLPSARLGALLQDTQKNTVSRPLPPGRTLENPISQDAVLVPEDVSVLNKKPGFFARLVQRRGNYVPIADALFPPQFRSRVAKILGVHDALSSEQVRFGGPAVLKRLREGGIALVNPSVLGAYYNEEAGEGPGIGGGLFFTEPWTGPFTQTECGLGFYEVVEVGGTEYCDVIRYDFYDDDLNTSIAIALSVTEEQYCDAQCTQPACKAVCEALVEDDPATPIDESLNVAYMYDESTGLCGCGGPIYTSSCVDSSGNGVVDMCVQEPGGDGQSTCGISEHCVDTFFTCNEDEQCVEVGGFGIDDCNTDIDCRVDPTRTRTFEGVTVTGPSHTGCVGEQCVLLPEPGEDECSSSSQCPAVDCILELIDTDGDGVGDTEGCIRPAIRHTCVNDALFSRTERLFGGSIVDEFFTAADAVIRGTALGPQCAAVYCDDADGSGAIEPGECLDDCDPAFDDGQCGFEDVPPTVPFPQPIDGSEFDPPPLPELGSGGSVGGGTVAATCGDLGGGPIDPITGLETPNGIWDSCAIGNESQIQCLSVDDCFRLEHSQCAGLQCVVIPGPGINQCGDPADPLSLDPDLCAGGCGTFASTILASSNVTLFGTSCDAGFPETSTANQLQTMVDTASCTVNGITTNACGGSGLVTVLESIVEGTANLAGTGCSFTITSLANGTHASSASNHFIGQAIDIDVPSGCSTQQVLDAFCPLGLAVNSEGFTPGVDESTAGSHWHIGTDSFDDECP